MVFRAGSLNDKVFHMIRIRRSAERGFADHGWLRSHHSFSFAGYYDSSWMGWGNLRVINEDHVAPGTGFGLHPHRDMEIVTYVMSGALSHNDSMGNGTTITPGEVQRMSAGRGIRHSEFNRTADQWTHLLQIWIEPTTLGIEPSYEQIRLDPKALRAGEGGGLCLIASPDGAHGSVTLNADARIHAAVLAPGQQASLALAGYRKAWVQLVRGRLSVNGLPLEAGDAALLDAESHVNLLAEADAEALVFDLAP